MIENWLRPADTENANPNSGALARIVPFYHTNPEALNSAKVAIVGVNPDNAGPIRQQLYRLAKFDVPLIDLGDLRNENPTFAIQLIGLLLKSNILPILIGGNQSYIFSLYHAYQLNEKMVNLAVIDHTIRFNAKANDPDAYLNQLLNPPHNNLFHLSLLATQQHFNTELHYQIIQDNNFDLLPLSAIDAEITDSEPFIRDADLVAFNLAAVKYSDFPARQAPCPTGLTTQQACAMARFAGLSDKLTAFGLFGFDADSDTHHISAQTTAMVIWYFLQGFVHRQKEFPLSRKNLKKYVVFHKKDDLQISFWKSEKTGRWWMEIPVNKPGKPLRHALLPCSYNDYLAATNGHLPDRLIAGLGRIS